MSTRFFTNSGDNTLLILGILNSKLSGWFISQTAAQMRGGWRSYEARFIRHIPIHPVNSTNPEEQAWHDRLVMLVDQILATKQNSVGASPCGCPPFGDHGANVDDPGKGDHKGAPLHENQTSEVLETSEVSRQPTDIPALEAEIDRLVYALYGLADNEIVLVEGKS